MCYVLLVVKARKHLTISKSGLKVYSLESAGLRLTIGKHGKIREEESSASPGKHASFRKCESYVLAYVTYMLFALQTLLPGRKGGRGYFLLFNFWGLIFVSETPTPL